MQVKTALQSATTKKVGNKIHGPYIKLSGCNKNRIQQPMRSNSEVLALLAHATTLDELVHIRDHTWPLLHGHYYYWELTLESVSTLTYIFEMGQTCQHIPVQAQHLALRTNYRVYW